MSQFTPGEVRSEIEPGKWCRRCNLPSAADVTYLLHHPETLAVVSRITRRVCLDCEFWEPIPVSAGAGDQTLDMMHLWDPLPEE